MPGKLAIVVGIDQYQSAVDLSGCVNDAKRLCQLLAENSDGSPNFDVHLLTSETPDLVSTKTLLVEVSKMFERELEVALLYFAGHGYVDTITDEGYLVTHDAGGSYMWGIPVSSILKLANKSNADSKIVIFDCCHSGSMGQLIPTGISREVAVLGSGVTIMTASKENEQAIEYGAHGLFTTLLIDGLEGAAANIEGRITTSSLYSHIDQSLALYEQRPLYKANVQAFIKLRSVAEKVSRNILRKLFDDYFRDGPDTLFKLGPDNEPDRGEYADKYEHISVNEERVKAYRDLQTCSKQGLVVPVDAPFMWHASMLETGCKLTALGRYYWKRRENGRL